MVRKWRLNHHVSSLSFSLKCKHGKLRQTRSVPMTFRRYRSIGGGLHGRGREVKLRERRGGARGARVRPIRPEGGEGTWQTPASLLQSTHSRAHIHLQDHFLSPQAALYPSIFPASHATRRKQVFISSRWAWGGVGGPPVRYASLFLPQQGQKLTGELIKGCDGCREARWQRL